MANHGGCRRISCARRCAPPPQANRREKFWIGLSYEVANCSYTSISGRPPDRGEMYAEVLANLGLVE